MTWLEIVDSGVKIGLGALISGTSAYVTLKSRNRHEREAENVSRRIEILERITNYYEAFTEVFNDFIYSCPLAGELSSKHDDIYGARSQMQLNFTAQDVVVCKTKSDVVRQRASDLRKAQTLLRLMGRKDAFDAMTRYRDTAEEFWLTATEKLESKVDINEFIVFRKAISDRKRDVYEELSKIYPVL